MSDDDIALVSEQFRHILDMKDADINALRAELRHYSELANRRLDALEKESADHEQRLRNVTDGVTQFKMFAGLASGGSSIVALIALFKAFVGVQ